MLLRPERSHNVLLSRYMVHIDRGKIYTWKQFSFTGRVHSAQLTISDVVIPRFSCCILTASGFQLLTELFHIFDIRETDRQSFCKAIGPELA